MKDVVVIASQYSKDGECGDFSWMIERPEYADTLFIFNDNEQQFRDYLNDPSPGDTRLVPELAHLPPDQSGQSDPGADPLRSNLAFRNLIRARMLRLATGQQMAQFLRSRGVSVQVLSKKQLRDGNDGAELSRLKSGELDAVLKRTPLWFYVLREADVMANGERLGPVGGRIVAEVIIGLITGDQHSYLRQDPDWTPTYGPDGSFTAVDLLGAAGVVAELT